MATKRKPLPKKIRFEVFKRDSFRCQYCGRSAPDVVLECDHIVPVSEGGKDEIMNLVTSCRSCNRGKSNIPLDDSEILRKQKEELDNLNEKREQLEMMLKWKEELINFSNEQLKLIITLIEDMTGMTPSPRNERIIRSSIKQFGFDETYEAVEISILQYFDDRNEWQEQKTLNYAMSKVCGICYNRRKNRQDGNL